MDKEQAKAKMELFDSTGAPFSEDPPRHLTATWMRSTWRKGPARVSKPGEKPNANDPIEESLLRAQVPYIVTLLVYSSKLQMEPDRQEYLLYAPQEIQKASELAVRLWQRWGRPKRKPGAVVYEDLRDAFPKLDDMIVAEPIRDSDFDDHWKDVKKRPHRFAGDPDDPFAFTCSDADVKLFKLTSFTEGLSVTV